MHVTGRWRKTDSGTHGWRLLIGPWSPAELGAGLELLSTLLERGGWKIWGRATVGALGKRPLEAFQGLCPNSRRRGILIRSPRGGGVGCCRTHGMLTSRLSARI